MRPIGVEVHTEHRSTVSPDWVAQLAGSALAVLSLPADSYVEVVVTDDETVRELNLRHRGVDQTTDVLAFATAPDGDRPFVLPSGCDAAGSIGEVVISWPQAARQAALVGREPADEIAFLLAHGILHLVGHDHEEPEERDEMEAEHRRLLQAMLGSKGSSIEVKYPQ